MKPAFHIINGDAAGEKLKRSGIPGDVLIWRDLLYDGPRNEGWPEEDTLGARASFLSATTGGGLPADSILQSLKMQYLALQGATSYGQVVLWFDACLCDQSMLCHLLSCLKEQAVAVFLIGIDSYPGIDPFHGLGQLGPEQLASLYPQRQPATPAQFSFAEKADRAFALQDRGLFGELAELGAAPLPFVPKAVARWLDEQPDQATGLGQLERLSLQAIVSGCHTPGAIFSHVAAHDTPPQYWGDTTLWAKINGLAARAVVRIEGPAPKLPQWNCQGDIGSFRVYLADDNHSNRA